MPFPRGLAGCSKERLFAIEELSHVITIYGKEGCKHHFTEIKTHQRLSSW